MDFYNKLRQSDSLAQLYRFFKRLYIRYIYGLKNVHKTFNIGGRCTISKDFKANEYSYVGSNCLIYPGVSIGRYTMLAQNVQIIGADHNYKIPGTPTTFSGRLELKPTQIGRDVWIGANSIIFTGVSIGDGVIIGAGSIVTKNVEPYSIYAGVPAKFVKQRFSSDMDILKHNRMLDGKVLKSRRNKPLKKINS